MAYDPMLSLCRIADFASGTKRFQKIRNSPPIDEILTNGFVVLRCPFQVFSSRNIFREVFLFFYSFMASRGSTRIFWKISLEKERDAELIEINFYKGILFQKNHLP